MVGPAAFSYWHRRPDHQPEDRISGRRPKSGYQPSNPVEGVVRRNLCAHIRKHKYSGHAAPVAGNVAALQIENVIAEEASKTREKPLRPEKSQGGAERGPLWREIKLLCVVYATMQGTGISYAPPKPSLFLALSLRHLRMPSYY